MMLKFSNTISPVPRNVCRAPPTLIDLSDSNVFGGSMGPHNSLPPKKFGFAVVTSGHFVVKNGYFSTIFTNDLITHRVIDLGS